MNRYAESGRAALRRVGLASLFALFLAPAFAAGQSVPDKYEQMRRKQSAFNLTSAPTQVLQVNKFQCGVRNQGDTCSDVFNSPTGGGGFWPTGTPDQYMFNSGIQVVGIIPTGANFEWAGDTVGAFFMDASGLRAHGTPVTEIYNSLDPNDLDNWPDAGSFPDFPQASAYVTDTDLFNDVLIGRKAASQQDSWVMYWDGDPGPTGGRVHPMGILVEQRTLAWNYPTGNESIIYIIYRFTNVTNNALFQRLNETKFFGGANALPDEGWRIDSMYVAYDSDPDVTHDFDKNYATGILPFNLGIAYEGTFFEPEFDYPPSEFFPPFFANAPGILGVKFLKSPVDPATGEEVGLTSLSLHTNGGAFRDPSDVKQGWRYISLNVDAGKGDPSCTFAVSEIKAKRACYLGQSQSDVRFFIGSGPFSLDAGESATIAVAMFAAATVNTPDIALNGDNKPEFPSLQPGCGDAVRAIEKAAGWVNTLECPTDPTEPVDQNQVQVVPNSLLGKALVAQAIFDNKFLLGFAPDNPIFYLVPGNNQMTVVWEPSRTEQDGDPFYVAAGDPESPLYDPNYRQFDVEGYRIYRGTTPGNLKMVAQFDKAGSTFTDNLCVTDPTYVAGDDCEDVDEIDITGAFVQYPVGGVVRLDDGSTFVVNADTAMAALVSAGNARPLSNTGVPFAFVDKDVRNGFQYFYKVTAFDINSLRSGPSSLESAGPSKSATPRAPASSLSDVQYRLGTFGRGDTPLEESSVTIDPVTGTFSGPQPPTQVMKPTGFTAFAPQVLPTGVSKLFRIDSIVPDYYGGTWYITSGDQQLTVTLNSDAITGDPADEFFDLGGASLASDPSARQALIAKGVDAPPLAGSLAASLDVNQLHFQSNDNDWAYQVPNFWSVVPEGTEDGGSRWFSGDNETEADPTVGYKYGSLDGITTIFKPVPYAGQLATYHGTSGNFQRRFYQSTWSVRRAADMKVFWGAAGVDSVIDVTHNVPVAFSGDLRATYGFVTDADGDGVITHADFWYIPWVGEVTPNLFIYAANDPTALVSQPVVMPTDGDGDLAADGTGFGLYIAGEVYQFVGSPPTNTVWTLRTYNGVVNHVDGVYSFTPSPGTPGIPGLSVGVIVDAPATVVASEANLDAVHTVPDPYYAVSQFDLSPATKELKFVNLPATATIRIYSLSGVLVTVLNHDDPAAGGQEPWNLRNRSNQFVASGVYFYHVSTPDGKSRIGKFTVVNSGFAR